MLDTIKAQYESGEALIQSKNYGLSKRETWPSFFHDLYPVGQEYYFELNPYFTFNIYRPELYAFAKTFFVRDGRATFAAFILKNYNYIPKAKTSFLIHPDLAPMVPPNFQQYFSCWEIVQPKKIPIKNAKRVLIFGILVEQYLGNVDNVSEKLKCLEELDPEIELDIYLPLRKEPFSNDNTESVLSFQVIARIKEIVGTRKINFIKTKELLEKSHFKDHYLIDLAINNFTISDNFIHYLIASKGGTVGCLREEAPKDSIFKLALSFHHELHITPLPEVKSVFMDLLFVKKTSSVASPAFDPAIHEIIRY